MVIIEIWDGESRVLEHRYIMEQHLGRKLESCELIHHINGIKADNRIENLKIVSSTTHQKEHILPDEKWSMHYEKCIDFGTTERKHAGHGFCSKCNQYKFEVDKRGYECEYQDGKRVFTEEHREKLKEMAILREVAKKYKKCCLK